MYIELDKRYKSKRDRYWYRLEFVKDIWVVYCSSTETAKGFCICSKTVGYRDYAEDAMLQYLGKIPFTGEKCGTRPDRVRSRTS